MLDGLKHTARGFEFYEFKDSNGDIGQLQASSIAENELPGSSAIWLGPPAHRLHIGLEQVKELHKVLGNWIETGRFERGQ